jgi:hypothetical protein
MRILQDLLHVMTVMGVLSTQEETRPMKIMFLHPNGPSLPYTYPARPNILLVHRQDILMKTDLCTATGRTYTLRAEENEKKRKGKKKRANVIHRTKFYNKHISTMHEKTFSCSQHFHHQICISC